MTCMSPPSSLCPLLLCYSHLQSTHNHSLPNHSGGSNSQYSTLHSQNLMLIKFTRSWVSIKWHYSQLLFVLMFSQGRIALIIVQHSMTCVCEASLLSRMHCPLEPHPNVLLCFSLTRILLKLLACMLDW